MHIYNGTLFLSNFSIQDLLTKTGSKNSKKALRTWFKKSQCCEKYKFFKRKTTSDEPALMKRKLRVKENKDQFTLLFVICKLFGWEIKNFVRYLSSLNFEDIGKWGF